MQTVTDNFLRRYAAGPVGTSLPARDNVADYPLPDVNSVDAS